VFRRHGSAKQGGGQTPSRNSVSVPTFADEQKKNPRGPPQALISTHLIWSSTTFTGGIPNRIQETFRSKGLGDKMAYPRLNQLFLNLINHA
jgi:hypothetical protein